MTRRTIETPFALAAVAVFFAAGFAVADEPTSVARLEVFPAKLDLDGAHDVRRLIVTGVLADGSKRDLTPQSKYSAPADSLQIDAAGYVSGLKDGDYALAVKALDKTIDVPVRVRNLGVAKSVSFVRDVEPMLAKVGCNAGTCHGSAKGKRGFKLSLRGYDPAFDYEQLVEDLAGRHFNRSDPEQSLMLLKPTNIVPHEGGYVLDPNTPPYAVLRDWIAQGVQSDAGKTARASSLRIYPPAVELAREEQTQQLLVLAEYPDGSTRDVTRDANFSSSVPDIALVEQNRPRSLRPPRQGRGPRALRRGLRRRQSDRHGRSLGIRMETDSRE